MYISSYCVILVEKATIESTNQIVVSTAYTKHIPIFAGVISILILTVCIHFSFKFIQLMMGLLVGHVVGVLVEGSVGCALGVIDAANDGWLDGP